MNINPELQKYIELNIFPVYHKNDKAHGIEHIKYVIERSIMFANTVENINYDMVYTIAAYHDLGHHIDPKNHEKISSEMLLADTNLGKYFTEEEISIMADAVYDHRASMDGDPRSIYGKIVSSADRNTLIEHPMRRTYEYRIKNNPTSSLEEIVEESRQHIINKFGKAGYAKDKMYFEDKQYEKFLKDISELAENEEEFKKKYYELNRLNNPFKLTFDEIKRKNSQMSLDEILYAVYNELKNDNSESFDILRKRILEENNIDEYEYYVRGVNQDLQAYVEEKIFPQYEPNDQAHGIVHICEVIRRALALNDTFKLELDVNMVYAIAAYHDLGKYEDHTIHEKIAANRFINDDNMKEFFDDNQRIIIKEAIEDHRSSKEDEPRSIYGKLISSADRNTTIEIVFIRSFFVAKERQPETIIEDYLDYTLERLSKKYSEENPENMFFEDQTYKVFLNDMRNLLKDEEAFKNKYCEVNGITSREAKVKDYQGQMAYIKCLKKR